MGGNAPGTTPTTNGFDCPAFAETHKAQSKLNNNAAQNDQALRE